MEIKESVDADKLKREEVIHENSSEGKQKSILSQVLRAPVIIAALGYFVDIYDLLLFSIVRIPSLKALGLTGDQLLKEGIFLINVQMAGLLVGGILWGF